MYHSIESKRTPEAARWLPGRGYRISGAPPFQTTADPAVCACKIGGFIRNMGKGRKPLPDAVKVMRGTDQPCRLSGGDDGVERITDIRQITSAARLKLLPTKRAKDIFKQKANQLIALRILTELDLEHLAVYANSLDVLFSCLEGMRLPAKPKYGRDGQLIGYVPRPEIALYRQMVDQVNRIGAEFGFTPVSRQRINQQPPEERDELDELLKIR